MVARFTLSCFIVMKFHSHIIVARFTLSYFIADGRELHFHITVARFILVRKKLNYKGKNYFALRELKPASLNSILLKVSLKYNSCLGANSISLSSEHAGKPVIQLDSLCSIACTMLYMISVGSSIFFE